MLVERKWLEVRDEMRTPEEPRRGIGPVADDAARGTRHRPLSRPWIVEMPRHIVLLAFRASLHFQNPSANVEHGRQPACKHVDDGTPPSESARGEAPGDSGGGVPRSGSLTRISAAMLCWPRKVGSTFELPRERGDQAACCST